MLIFLNNSKNRGIKKIYVKIQTKYNVYFLALKFGTLGIIERPGSVLAYQSGEHLNLNEKYSGSSSD